MKLMRIGVDLTKSVFQIHGVDRHEQPVWRQRLPRDRWLQTVLVKIEPGCEIGMEKRQEQQERRQRCRGNL